MKGIIGALALLIISLVFGQVLDQSIDAAIAVSSGINSVLLNVLKILVGFPNDIIEFALKILVYLGILIGGEAI